jgi:hypothetical protein
MSTFDYGLNPYLHVNPQCHVQESHDRIGLNSRLYSKDMYILNDQIFWDNGEVLPVEKPIQKTKCLYTKINYSDTLNSDGTPNISIDPLKPMNICYD